MKWRGSKFVQDMLTKVASFWHEVTTFLVDAFASLWIFFFFLNEKYKNHLKHHSNRGGYRIINKWNNPEEDREAHKRLYIKFFKKFKLVMPFVDEWKAPNRPFCPFGTSTAYLLCFQNVTGMVMKDEFLLWFIKNTNSYATKLWQKYGYDNK